MAWQGATVSLVVIVAFAIFGKFILDYLHISVEALQGSMKVTNNNKTIKVEKGAVSVSVNVGNLKDQKAVDSAVEAAVNRAFTKLTRTLAAKS